MDIGTKGIARAVQYVPGLAQPVVQGRPKSGRPWKAIQRTRSSSQIRKGPLQHMSKSFGDRQVKRVRLKQTKALGKESFSSRFSFINFSHMVSTLPYHTEQELKDNTKAKREEKKAKIIERRKLKMENEYKNTTYQVINPEKMKRMNKKQLRMIKKTSVNKDGTVEFVSPFAKTQDNSAHARKIIDTSNGGGKRRGKR